MLDHIGLRVTHLEKSTQFYLAALAPLGYVKMMEFPGTVGFALDGKPDFWLIQSATATPAHVAFVARDRKTVAAFHQAALEAGGTDNGPPGPRAYHPNYFGAFIFDPDGHNIEAVVHTPA